MFMEAEDRRRLSLMAPSVDTRQVRWFTQHSLRACWASDQPTQIQKLVQLLPADHHVSVAAELHLAEVEDVLDLLLDHLQGLRLAQ